MSCIICKLPIYGRLFGIAMFEGEPVPNDWQGDWAGCDCCEQCYQGHQRWQHDPVAVQDWINSVRNPTQPMNAS
jgi:hypothetical protein